MQDYEIYGLSTKQKITLVNLIGSIIFNSSTPKDSIDKFIDLIKNEAQRLNLPQIIQSLINDDLLAKDSKHD